MTRSHATTGLLAIRNFLNRHDSVARPWSNAPEAVDRLLAILRARRGDDAFWADLRLLANRLEDDQFDRAAARRRGVIEGDRLDSLVDELRAKLDGNGGVTAARGWIAQPTVTGAAALAFCMLGSSFACFGGDGDDDDDGNGGGAATCTDAVTQSLKGAEAEVYCDLAGLIKSSSLSTSDKADLMECLPNLGAQMRADLLDSFQNLSDAELAAELTDLLNNGLCAPYHDGAADDDTNVDDDDSWSDDDDDSWSDDDGGH